jgi:hypothetical protein
MSWQRHYSTEPRTTYYPSQHRGHQCLILDVRTVIGRPDSRR